MNQEQKNQNRVPMLDLSKLNKDTKPVDYPRTVAPEEKELIKKNAIKLSKEESERLQKEYQKSKICIIQ